MAFLTYLSLTPVLSCHSYVRVPATYFLEEIRKQYLEPQVCRDMNPGTVPQSQMWNVCRTVSACICACSSVCMQISL